MTLNPYLSSVFLFGKSQLEMGQKMPSLMLCPIGFVRIQTQIARHWSRLIPEYWNHLNLGHHLNPRIAIEKMGKISHQMNSWIQTIARMKTMRTRMMRAVATELQTGYHHHPFVAWHNR
jgi:hypothetical protein